VKAPVKQNNVRSSRMGASRCSGAAQSRNRLGRPAGGFEYLYVSYDSCSDGVPSAGCLARVLSATRGQLS
jgi:hypothetical protein